MPEVREWDGQTLRPDLRSDGGARAQVVLERLELRGRRDGARRRLRLGADHRSADRAAAARPGDRGGRVALDGRRRPRAARRRTRTCAGPTCWSWSALEEPVDAILSTATFHWIADHERLFARLHAALRPGGRLVAQCGGEGNIDVLRGRAGVVLAREPYAEHFRDLAAAVELRRPRDTPRAAARRPASRRPSAG